jgi:hypothetical protein
VESAATQWVHDIDLANYPGERKFAEIWSQPHDLGHSWFALDLMALGGHVEGT